MAFFSPSPPAYKTVSQATTYAQPTTTSGLSGLLRSWFGGAAPAYKKLDGLTSAPQAVSTSRLFQVFTGTVPSYKTAQPATLEPAEESASDDGDDGDAGDPCAPECLAPDEIILL